MNRTWTDILTISVPVAAPLLALGSYGLAQLSRYLAVQNHNSRLAAIASAASTAAGNIAIKLSQLPPGVDLATARHAFVQDATDQLKSQLGGMIAATGYPDAALEGKIAGAVGNNPLHAAIVAQAPAPAPAPAPASVMILGGH